MNQLNLSILCLAIALPSVALALPEDREKPIEIEAESAELDQNSGVIIYSGNVVVSQGTMRLAADTGKIFLVEGNVSRMEASGAPTTFRYQPSANDDVINGRGQRVEYNVDDNMVIVTGEAHFTKGQDQFTGDRITYDLTTDLVKATSQPGGRVRFIIQPRPEKN